MEDYQTTHKSPVWIRHAFVPSSSSRTCFIPSTDFKRAGKLNKLGAKKHGEQLEISVTVHPSE